MLNFQPTWHQQRAAQSLNCLADLMKQQPGEMEQTRAWETLGLGDFGPQQVNLLTELSPQSTLHDEILEVVVDKDPDEPPGLEPILEDEVENDEVPNLEANDSWARDGQFGPLIWTQMCDPLSPAQLALIHQMEHVGACPGVGQTLTSAV